MNLIEATKSCFSNATNFSGRAPRSEYWYFVLFQFLCGIAINSVSPFLGVLIDSKEGILLGCFIAAGIQLLVFFLPSLAASVRRLHDTGRSGAWWFISFLPLIGGIWLLVLMCLPSDEENKYGIPVY